MYLKKIFYSSIIAEVFDSFKLNAVIPVWCCVSLPGSCANLLGLNTDELADEIYLARGIISVSVRTCKYVTHLFPHAHDTYYSMY
jgi:hypothetical protein